jgi:serine/threonine protein kinase
MQVLSDDEKIGEQATKLDWQQRLNVCVGLARGLSYLHEELQPRIIHRDIKPGNILLDRHYNPKIADFGLARSMLEDQTEAEFTQIAGTKYVNSTTWPIVFLQHSLCTFVHNALSFRT